MDESAKRTALRMIPYAIFLATTRYEEEVRAFIGTWLSQASFEPPMVVMCVKKESWSIDIIKKSKIVAVSIFGEGQKELARKFLRRVSCESGKLNDVPYELGKAGAPVLIDVPAYFECKVVNIIEGGDHDVLLCEVIEAKVRRIENSLTTTITGWKYGG